MIHLVRRQCIIHAVARSRPKPEEQTVPGFVNTSKPVGKSQAVYHMNPPSKTILYDHDDVMCKLTNQLMKNKMVFLETTFQSKAAKTSIEIMQ